MICTDIAPFREQARRHGMEARAFVVPTRDETALAEALRTALHAGEAEAEPDVEALRRRVEAWTWDDAARAYLEYLGRA